MVLGKSMSENQQIQRFDKSVHRPSKVVASPILHAEKIITLRARTTGGRTACGVQRQDQDLYLTFRIQLPIMIGISFELDWTRFRMTFDSVLLTKFNHRQKAPQQKKN